MGGGGGVAATSLRVSIRFRFRLRQPSRLRSARRRPNTGAVHVDPPAVWMLAAVRHAALMHRSLGGSGGSVQCSALHAAHANSLAPLDSALLLQPLSSITFSPPFLSSPLLSISEPKRTVDCLCSPLFFLSSITRQARDHGQHCLLLSAVFARLSCRRPPSASATSYERASMHPRLLPIHRAAAAESSESTLALRRYFEAAAPRRIVECAAACELHCRFPRLAMEPTRR